MQIQNEDPNTSKLGEEYESSGDGVFIVPDELGAQLIKFPHWRVYDGNPWPRERTPEEVDQERLAAIVHQAVQALPPAPAKKPAKAPAPKPAKAPAKKAARKVAKKKAHATTRRGTAPQAPAKAEAAPAAAAKSDGAGDATKS